MDVSSLAAAATAYKAQMVGDAIAVTVLRKALDVQAQDALALVQALPQVTPSSALPENLGQNLNVVA